MRYFVISKAIVSHEMDYAPTFLKTIITHTVNVYRTIEEAESEKRYLKSLERYHNREFSITTIEPKNGKVRV